VNRKGRWARKYSGGAMASLPPAVNGPGRFETLSEIKEVKLFSYL